MRFGRVVVIERTENIADKVVWLCACDCGVEKAIRSGQLLSGRARSCGCLKIDIARMTNFTHGESRRRLYRIWGAMRKRCLNQNDGQWHNYGGRGIAVCDEWSAYEPFKDWSLGNGYLDHLTLDRRNSDGNYEPTNYRWTTQREQNRNTRRNHLVNVNGESMCVADAAERHHQIASRVRARLRIGWSTEESLGIVPRRIKA